MKKLAWGALLLLTLASAALWSWWHYRLEPDTIAEITRGQMSGLADAAILFNTKKGRLPESLEELVREGFLPREGTIYFNPMLHDSRALKNVAYSACEYTMTFAGDAVRVGLPKASYGRGRFASVDGENWEYKVTPGVRLLAY